MVSSQAKYEVEEADFRPEETDSAVWDNRDDVEPKEGWFGRTFPRVRWVPSNPTLLQEAEERILKHVKTKSRGRYVDVGTINGDPARIWTRQFGEHRVKEGGPAPLVMLHGMASGVALFGLNYPDLVKDRPVFAIDLPGFARSSRPSFSHKRGEAEEQYVASIEEWRKQMGLGKICLLGHSFGGYLAASYALKHPDRLKHVILVDPWGFPEQPKEITGRRNIPIWVRALYPIFKNFNPLASVRLMGPWGMGAMMRVRGDLMHKYDDLFDTEEEAEAAIPPYIYHCNGQSPTGESAFHSLMEGFAWAKSPMFQRLDKLDPDVPLTAIYGGDSWMKTIHQEDFVDQTGRKGREDCYTRVKVLPHAGHHVYADQWELFNREVNAACAFSDRKYGQNQKKH